MLIKTNGNKANSPPPRKEKKKIDMKIKEPNTRTWE
jgi:hypothetical protein